MAGMDHSKMAGSPAGRAAPMNHASMTTPPDSAGRTGSMNMMGMNMDRSAMMQMHMRMMEDPVIRERVMRDTTMRRLMNEMMQSMPAGHGMNMSEMTPARARTSAPSSSTREVTPTWIIRYLDK